ncbi:protein IWS1 homolog isoform X2 [Nothobranchius furzeri]|uniref:Interacts with SUPT6H, CTD assembly factor 1 n=1 Tax=Nothobranchius furzeri TaxID=105023 RepID=A0A8C6K8Z3_NOTFU|nr:protein IWS1 homolog isoform X2 [Nothobranchius furzeri]
MDGEEDDFMSGSHSDDGDATPVQDENPPSDGEDMRSDHHSEDEGSNDAMETGGPASGSDTEDRREANSDSDGEAPGSHHGRSDSEAEAPAPADSDEDSPVKRRMSASDNEEEEESPEKRQAYGSDNEEEGGSSPVKHDASDKEEEEGGSSPIKHNASDNEEEGGPSPIKHDASENEEERSSPTKRRGSSSEVEDGEEVLKAAANSDSEEEAKAAASPDRRSDSDSENETPARRKTAQINSEEEEEKQEEEGGGKWKGKMQSDSEEEEEQRQPRKAAAGSDEEEQQQEEEKQQRDDSDEDDEAPVKRKKAVLSDSEEEEEEKAGKPAVKRSRAMSDDENSDSDDGSAGLDTSLAAKLKELGSDSGSDDDDRTKAATGKKDEKALFGSDSESGDEQEKMIADIFGESGDEEGEEFTGFNQEDLETDNKESKEKQQVEQESDSDEGVHRGGQDMSFMSDFDIMLAKRKAMNSKKRRHRDGGTFISDADDVVSAMITKMNEAAEEDRTLNSQKKPALKKLTLLPQVVMHLKKQDLKETFIDSGVMSAIKEWISPLPDKSLPALRIREELLRILQELPGVSQETLKHSGIGRAVMFLYKHPKESRPNKDIALKLINEWSRPIFGLTSNYKGMTREERQQRDLDQQTPQRRRLSEPLQVERVEEPDVFSPPTSSGGQTPRRDLEKQLTGEEKALRPGDPGFCARARVPLPSNKDYVVRPKWNVEGDSSRSGCKKAIGLLEKHKRRFAEERKMRRPQGAVKISIEGNRMPL